MAADVVTIVTDCCLNDDESTCEQNLMLISSFYIFQHMISDIPQLIATKL